MRKLIVWLLFGSQWLPAAAQTQPANATQIHALIESAESLIEKPGEDKIDLDSAAFYLKKAQAMNSSLGNTGPLDYLTLTESLLYKEEGHRDTARLLCAKALQLAKTNDNKALLGKAYYELAGYYEYDRSDELAQRLLLTDSAVSAYRAAGMLEREAFTIKALAELHLNKDEYSKCLAECDTCLRIYEKIQFKWIQPVYDLIGSAYFALGDNKHALSNGLHALEIAHDLHDSTMQLCEIEYNIGAIFQKIRDTVAAIAHLSNALNIAFLHHDQTNSYLVAGELIRIYAKSPAPGKGLKILTDLQNKYTGSVSLTQKFTLARCYVYIYTALREFKRSQPYLDQLAHLATTPGAPPETLAGIYLVVVRAYLAAERYKTAETYLALYRDAANATNNPQFRKYIYQFSFQLDTARHQYSPAVADLTEYDRIRDSIAASDQANEINRLNVAYETAEREKHIQSLQGEKILQQHQLAASNEFRNFAIGGVILSILTMAIGYSRFRLKQEKNRQLEVKQHELQKEREEVSRQNVELARLLSENEWLLREVHHRVKNNLQIVKNLLDSQAVFLKDENAQKAIRESQHRVQAMSLIHQKLYSSNNASTIYMPDYINELIDYLKGSFDTRQRIYFRREIGLLYLDVSHAVPVGLILNEVITNAIKYAFPHTDDHQITIHLFESGPGAITLFIADNGIGLPPDLDSSDNSSFGFRLINGLTEELGGKLTIENVGGTAINLTFPYHARGIA